MMAVWIRYNYDECQMKTFHFIIWYSLINNFCYPSIIFKLTYMKIVFWVSLWFKDARLPVLFWYSNSARYSNNSRVLMMHAHYSLTISQITRTSYYRLILDLSYSNTFKISHYSKCLEIKIWAKCMPICKGLPMLLNFFSVK